MPEIEIPVSEQKCAHCIHVRVLNSQGPVSHECTVEVQKNNSGMYLTEEKGPVKGHTGCELSLDLDGNSRFKPRPEFVTRYISELRLLARQETAPANI